MTESERPGRWRRIEGFSLQGKKKRRPVSSGTHLRLVCAAAKWRREHNGEEGEEHHFTGGWGGLGKLRGQGQERSLRMEGYRKWVCDHFSVEFISGLLLMLLRLLGDTWTSPDADCTTPGCWKV